MLPAVADFYCPAFKREAKAQGQQRPLGRPMLTLCFFATLLHALPPARWRAPLQFVAFVLSFPFVDSILSTRFCRLWFVDSILSTLVCRLIEISPLCRSNVLGKAIAMPTPFARPNYESSKFFRKKCCSAFRIFHEKIFEV